MSTKKTDKEEIKELKLLVKQLLEEKKLDKNETKKDDLNGYFPPDRRVVLVGLYDFAEGCSNYFKISHREFKFTKLGQRISISFLEFEEVINNHRRLFEQGLLTVSEKDNDIADFFDLPRFDKNALGIDVFKNIVNLSLKELEDIYNKVCDIHKSLIIAKWIRGYWDFDSKRMGSDAGYNDHLKIELLNRLSNGAMKIVLDDIYSKKTRGIL
jgi:hypothetical protein